MKISIVIPAINESGLIVDSIDRAWAAGCDEVVVADGGSSDGTPDLVRSSGCGLVVGAPGRGRQMNAGAKTSTGDLLLFLHADGWLDPGVCQQIRNSKRIRQNAWGGFRQKIENERFIFRLLETGNAWRAKFQGLVYGDQALFVTRQMFDKIGGFPEIALMEDFEMSRELGKISRPLLLPGPIHVDARRWEINGVIRQTLRNWSISTAYRCGKSPDELAKRYRRHDQHP